MGWRTGEPEAEIAELQIASDLINQGCEISIPFAEYRYDIIADKRGNLTRVQVKKANQISSNKYRLLISDYTESEVDIFAGYIPESGDTFYVASSEVGENNFRINTKKENEIQPSNRSQANPLENYTFERALSDWKNQ